MEKMKCYGCEERYPGCHGKCDYYTEWKKIHDEKKARINEYESEKSAERSHRIKMIERSKKR